VLDAEGEARTREDAFETALDAALERAVLACRIVEAEDRLELRLRDRLPVRAASEAAQDLRGALTLAS
jgi:hypothetical protein